MKESNLYGKSALSGPVLSIARRVLRKVAVGKGVTYGRDLRVGRGAIVSSEHGLRIGNSVSIGPRSIVQVAGEIGDFTLIGMGVQIVGRDDHAIRELGRPYIFATWVGEREARSRDRVTIGRDVWIGAQAVVLSGTTIGEGALVAAGAVVVHDVKPYEIVAGNPARIVGRRFSDEDGIAHSEALDRLSRRD